MRKLFTRQTLFTLVFCFFSGFLSAQCLIQESFEGASLPSGWTSTENSADGVGEFWTLTTTTPYHGTRAITCDGNYSDPISPWLTSPGVSITAGQNYKIRYYYKFTDLNTFDPATFSLKYSTTTGFSGTFIVGTTKSSSVSTSWALQEVIWTAPSTATYYFKWHAEVVHKVI